MPNGGGPGSIDWSRGSRRWRPGVVVALLVALVALLLPLTPPLAAAEPVVPFNARFSTDDNGTVAIFGNNLMSCPASDSRCADARSGAASLNNNSFVMTHLDADSDASTFNSSAARVEIPADGEVLWAGLYWGARVSRGAGGVAGTGTRGDISLRVPGASGYQTVSSEASFGPTAGDLAYQEFAEITDLVAAAGAGSYWGANVVAGTGEDRYAGWSLVVAYRAPGLPLRNLTVFDGFADVGRAEPQQILLSGFRSPTSGPIETQLGMVAYEGDYSASGDTARLNDTLLSTTPLSRGNNFFNGTNDTNGASVAARTPAHLNMLGYDIKNLGASGIPNGATSATISLESTGDRYFPGVVTTAIRLFAPDFTTSSKTVANLAGRTPGIPGDVLEYTLTYPNTGQDAAVDVVMTDTLPPGTTFVSAEPTAGTCAAAGQIVECDVGTIAVGAVWQAKVRALVEPGAADTTLTNAAVLDYTAQTLDRDLRYLVTPASIPIAAVADLAIEKTMAPAQSLAGGEVTATLLVSNAGPNTAAGVVVTDQLPAGVTFVSAAPEQGTCRVASGTVTCDLGSVTVDQQVAVDIVMSIPPGSTAQSLVNVASVSSSTPDLDPEDNSFGTSVAVARQADLVVTKTVDDATLAPGETTTYTVTVRNDGPSTATGVVATDTVSNPVLILTGATAPDATCSVGADRASCRLPVLAPGASMVMTVEARLSPDASPGATVENVASASTTTPDPDSGNDTATAAVTVAAAAADLAVAKEVGTAVAGGQATYTVVVTNNGPSTAREVVLDDVLPAGLTAASVVSSRGTCTVAATVTCTIGDLAGPDAAGQPSSATITLIADVPAAQPAAPITNTASVTSATADPASGNDTASASTTVQTAADLSVAKTADPVQPAAGEQVVFTMATTNAGPSVARDVVLVDTLPPGLVLDAVDAPAGVVCETAAETITCAVGDLDVAAAVTVTVTMTVPADFDLETGAVNAVAVSTATRDPVAGNDTAEATITTRAISDLIVLKWDTTENPTPDVPPRPFTAGEEVTYYLAVGNFGPSDASTAVLTDTLPDGVEFVSSVPECSFAAPSTVTCALPSVPNQFAAVFPVVVRVSEDLPAGTLLSNTATVELTDPNRVDPSTSNNTASRTNPVVTSADLNVVKRTYSLDLPDFGFTEPSAAPAGTPTGYLVEVRNDGPSIARDVVLTDSSTMTRFFVNQVRIVRDGVEDDITAQCSWSGGDLQCPIGDIPPFAAGAASWQIQVDGVTLSDAEPGEYVNTATLTSATPDADVADNTSAAPITVTDPVATLTIEKTAPGATDVDGDGDGDVVPGGTFSYEIVVANVVDLTREGAADAPDVVVTDTLPPGFIAEAATATQGGCSITPPGSVSCELGTVLGPGRVPEPAPVRITISGTTSPTLAGTTSVTNTATVSSPISADAQASVTNDVIAVADLAITKIADSDQIVAGGSAGFSLVVTNAGPSDAVGTQVGDLLPPELVFDPETSDPSCALASEAGNTYVACEIGTLAAGESRSVRVGATVVASQQPVELTNIAAVSSPTTGEYDFTNNRSDVPISIVTSADLVVTKTADATTQAVGEDVTYSVTVTNAGPSDASAVELTDPVPAGTTFVSVTATDGLACAEDGGVVTCTQDTVAAGAAATATIVVNLPTGLEPGPFENTATATSATPEGDPESNTASAVVDVFILADLVASKTVLTEEPVAGEPVEFAIDVVNNGPQTAPRVSISDTLAEGMEFVSATPDGTGSCLVTAPEGADIITCTLGSLAVGERLRVVVTALPDAALRSVVNGTLAGSAALDAVSDDNYDEVTFTLAAPDPGEPPTTEPPTTEPPEPPTSEPPVTEPPTTEPPTSAPGTPHPGSSPPATPPADGGLPGTGLEWPGAAAAWGVALLGLGALALTGRWAIEQRRRRGGAGS